ASSIFTVCGHSSGGSMASQHAVAFSDRVAGLGHFQAASWGCSRLINKSTEDYNQRCANSTASHAMAALVASAFERGDISSPTNLRQMPIFYYAGEWDTIVEPATVRAAAGFYQLLSERVVGLTVEGAEHAFECNACWYLGAPYLNDCRYDMAGHKLAGHMLAHLLGALSPAVPAPSRRLHRLKQSPYFPANASCADMGMGPHAFLYLPRGCRSGRGVCRLHVVYHGCSSSVVAIGSTALVLHAGFNPWAEANLVMVLYPQS
ncbi:hypothetical protein EMIHUDRAFT_43444, partial [Emiliania huxleyi CCMP1516]|uniref:Peptidase S9 prolyl oligopeptidase catalytic domain-containing protein n=2 Tax=Emiliania huxleyi TaxID=2903 RepID=A0A0D3J8Z1_EMIH1